MKSEVHATLGRSPTGLAETSSLSYGLFIRLRLLSTFSVENAVTIGYGAVTDSPIGTFTRQFNRRHRRTSYRRQTVDTRVHVLANEATCQWRPVTALGSFP